MLISTVQMVKHNICSLANQKMYYPVKYSNQNQTMPLSSVSTSVYIKKTVILLATSVLKMYYLVLCCTHAQCFISISFRKGNKKCPMETLRSQIFIYFINCSQTSTSGTYIYHIFSLKRYFWNWQWVYFALVNTHFCSCTYASHHALCNILRPIS